MVLVTHNHYDHMDLATLERLQASHDPLVITPLGNDSIIRSAIPEMRIQVQDWGDVVRVGPASIHCEPAHHWSARALTDRRMALWACFVVETRAGNIYHIGDTGFHSGINYRDVGKKHGGFRLANLPIGAYEPRWFMQSQHQNPQEAVQGMVLCGARHAVGHWGSFQLTDEAITQPEQDLRSALARAKIPPGQISRFDARRCMGRAVTVATARRDRYRRWRGPGDRVMGGRQQQATHQPQGHPCRTNMSQTSPIIRNTRCCER